MLLVSAVSGVADGGSSSRLAVPAPSLLPSFHYNIMLKSLVGRTSVDTGTQTEAEVVLIDVGDTSLPSVLPLAFSSSPPQRTPLTNRTDDAHRARGHTEFSGERIIVDATATAKEVLWLAPTTPLLSRDDNVVPPTYAARPSVNRQYEEYRVSSSVQLQPSHAQPQQLPPRRQLSQSVDAVLCDAVTVLTALEELELECLEIQRAMNQQINVPASHDGLVHYLGDSQQQQLLLLQSSKTSGGVWATPPYYLFHDVVDDDARPVARIVSVFVEEIA